MAEEIQYKFTNMRNAETVPIEELRNEVAKLKSLTEFYDTKQLAIKKFINSVYGALGSKYFVAYNTMMAESITAQGRELNHYSENSVNEYFEGIFQSNPKIVLYYQWVHYDADGNRLTFKDASKMEDTTEYYKSGKWEECKKWEKAVKEGKKLTPELKVCLTDNSQGHCDWFQTQTTLFKKLGITEEMGQSVDMDRGRTTKSSKLVGKEFDYLTNNKGVSMVCGGDTDSVTGDTNLRIKDNDNIKSTTIADFFNEAKIANNDTVLTVADGSEVVPVKNVEIQTYSPELDKAVYRLIRYVMRHKVSKARYKIKTASGKEVVVTGDHSCMVVRDNRLTAVKASEINIETDKIITI